jgi:hypothetical protein
MWQQRWRRRLQQCNGGMGSNDSQQQWQMHQVIPECIVQSNDKDVVVWLSLEVGIQQWQHPTATAGIII